MATTNRPRTELFGSGSTPITGVRLTRATRGGFENLREKFQERYPMVKCPSLSACLELALARYLEEQPGPKQLADDLADFRAKYGAPAKEGA
jgi:hypothetical protein